MGIIIVLLFIASGESPKVVDIYNTTAGSYGVCKQKASELNKFTKSGRWDCCIKRREDLK